MFRYEVDMKFGEYRSRHFSKKSWISEKFTQGYDTTSCRIPINSEFSILLYKIHDALYYTLPNFIQK